LVKLAAAETANMCSKKDDVPLLPFSSYLGAKKGQKQGLQEGGSLDVHVPRPYGKAAKFNQKIS